MNPYSGLVDLSEKKGLLTKQGNRLKYTTKAGEELIMFRKAWERNESEALDKLMLDISSEDETEELVAQLDISEIEAEAIAQLDAEMGE